MFYNRLQEACNERGKKISPLLSELGMSSSATGRWQEGTLPNCETLIKLAIELKVSTDYLLGLSESTQYPVNISDNINNGAFVHGDNSTAINGLSNEEADILKIYRDFDFDKRFEFLKALKDLKN